MRILIVGSGGREHALAWKLSTEAEVFVCPGNPGIAEVAELVPGSVRDFAPIILAAENVQADLVVVGPEDPLIAGLADELRSAGFFVFGPNADGARLEASKAWSKQLMQDAGVPTAQFATFDDYGEAAQYARFRCDSGRRIVVKASGAALGKGVVVCDDFSAAERALQSMLVEQELGDAGKTVVIEDRLSGPEFSLLTLVSGTEIRSLPAAQDYKRIGSGNVGPNTGGMGSYSPVPWVTPELIAKTEARVVQPMVNELAKRGIDYRGLIFSGLMMEGNDSFCLEYNVRFGDPETQSVMLRLGHGLSNALLACAKGEAIPEIEVLDNAALTVVMASEGYPASPRVGCKISIQDHSEDIKIFHAGTKLVQDQLETSGGRVFAISAAGVDMNAAQTAAYEGVKLVKFEGAQWRHDIGQ